MLTSVQQHARPIVPLAQLEPLYAIIPKYKFPPCTGAGTHMATRLSPSSKTWLAKDSVLPANSPERIDPCRKFSILQNVSISLGGVIPASTRAAFAFDSTVFISVVPFHNLEHAGATKLLQNSYRAVNTFLINEFTDYCEDIELIVKNVVNAATTKPYVCGSFHSWIGAGRHCIPVDPHYFVLVAIPT